MPEEPDPAQVMVIEPMVVAPPRQRRLRHVEVDHLLRTTGNRRHRKTAGVGKQVEHPLAGRLLAYPAAPVAHVEEQAVVLLLPEVELVTQAVFDDHLVHARLAQQPLAGAVRQVAVLDVDRRTRPDLARRQAAQHRLQRLKLPLGRLAKQRHQQHVLQPVDSDLLQPRPAAPAAMKQPPGLDRRRVQGGEQVLIKGVDGSGHGESRRAKAAYSTPSRRARGRRI